MSDYKHFFDDLNDMTAKMFTYTPLTDAERQASYLADIMEWANDIAGEWNGDESGSQEDRAHQANDILEKCLELKDLILGMDTL